LAFRGQAARRDAARAEFRLAETPLLIPAALSLAIFAWLLTLHPAAAGRVYAAYGGVYIPVALIWLWVVEGIQPSAWDWAGVTFSLTGMAIIAFQPG